MGCVHLGGQGAEQAWSLHPVTDSLSPLNIESPALLSMSTRPSSGPGHPIFSPLLG